MIAGPPPRIDHFAPTTVNALAACTFRVALVRSGAIVRRPNPFTSLGVVAHRMMEAYWAGRFSAVRQGEPDEELRAVWEALVRDEQAKLDAAYPVTTPPRATDWPGYALTKSRILGTIRRLLASQPDRSVSGWGDAEVELRDDTTGLYGRADRLEVHGEDVSVVDLKSGAWQHDVTEDQRRQLLLYGWLVHAVRGLWPTRLVIENAAGGRTALEATPRDMEQAALDARRRVDDYNDLADLGWGAIEASARPDSQTCARCPARVGCDPYWAQLTSAWRHLGAVRGTVESTVESAGARTVTARMLSPVDHAGQGAVLYQLRGTGPIERGTISVVAADERGPGALRCRWDTQVLWQGEGGASWQI